MTLFNSVISSVGYNKKIVQHVILCYAFTGRANASVIKKGKKQSQIHEKKLLRQIIISEMKKIYCEKCHLSNNSGMMGWSFGGRTRNREIQQAGGVQGKKLLINM